MALVTNQVYKPGSKELQTLFVTPWGIVLSYKSRCRINHSLDLDLVISQEKV